MKIIIQRVTQASVTIDNELKAKIGQGLFVLVGISKTDTMEHAKAMAKKIIGIRLWNDIKDPTRAWSSAVKENNFQVLMVPQPTVLSSDMESMDEEEANVYFEKFVKLCQDLYKKDSVLSSLNVDNMIVDVANDGPVTMILESPMLPSEQKKKTVAAPEQ